MSASLSTAPTLSAATLAATAPPPLARIAKIKIEDYRAFPAGDMLTIDLGDTGRNLLLYGENGSGKTSLARALSELVVFRGTPDKLETQRHLFGSQPAAPAQTVLAVEFTSGANNEFIWRAGDAHPSQTYGQPFQLFARGCLSLDYRDLLETNYQHRGTPNLFDCLFASVLDGLPVLHGGTRYRLGDLHRYAMEARPSRQTPHTVSRVTNACIAFSEALQNHLPEVVTAARKIFTKLGHPGTDFTLTPFPFAYNKVARKYTPGRIDFAVTHHGQALGEPQHFLNEARLTALALSLYLGAAQVVMSAPTPAQHAPAFTRVLVMDDVLIGLDLSNRLPLLRVLAEDFADWQIILLTHDRVWFELAKEHTEHSGGWMAKELCLLETPDGVPPRPVIKDGTDLLKRAKGHLAATPPDLMAAAVYLRATFETRLKNVCEKDGIEIAFKKQPKEVKTDALWLGVLERQKQREKYRAEHPTETVPDFIPAALIADVETMRSSILNRLSHSGTAALVKNEVEFALKAVQALQAHTFPDVQRHKVPVPPPATSASCAPVSTASP